MTATNLVYFNGRTMSLADATREVRATSMPRWAQEALLGSVLFYDADEARDDHGRWSGGGGGAGDKGAAGGKKGYEPGMDFAGATHALHGAASLAASGLKGLAKGAFRKLASIPAGTAKEVSIAAQDAVHSVGVKMAKAYNDLGEFLGKMNPAHAAVAGVMRKLHDWADSKWNNLEEALVAKHGAIKGRLILGTAGLLTAGATAGLGVAALTGAMGVTTALAAAGATGAIGGAVGHRIVEHAPAAAKMVLGVGGKVLSGAASMVGYLGAKMLGFGKDVAGEYTQGLREHLAAGAAKRKAAWEAKGPEIEARIKDRMAKLKDLHEKSKGNTAAIASIKDHMAEIKDLHEKLKGNTATMSLFAAADGSDEHIDFKKDILPVAQKLAKKLAASLHQAIHGPGTEAFWAKCGKTCGSAAQKQAG